MDIIRNDHSTGLGIIKAAGNCISRFHALVPIEMTHGRSSVRNLEVEAQKRAH